LATQVITKIDLENGCDAVGLGERFGLGFGHAVKIAFGLFRIVFPKFRSGSVYIHAPVMSFFPLVDFMRGSPAGRTSFDGLCSIAIVFKGFDPPSTSAVQREDGMLDNTDP
jgi:hypothetical protein